MKIRGRFKAVNPMVPLYVLVGLLVIAVPLRTYQLLFITEGDTGFYKTVNWTVYLMLGLSILAFLVPFIMVNLAKNIPSSKTPPVRKNKILAIASVLFGLGIAVDVISTCVTIFLDKSLVPFMERENIFPLLLEAVFGLLSVIYILVFGISYIDGKTTFSQYKFLALSPLVWAVGRIVISFLTRISYINIADLFFELIAIAFMMIFFLSLARISSGLASDTSMRSLFASGYVSVFFCLMTNIPRLVVFLTGNGGLLPDDYPLAPCDLFFAFFAVSYIVNAMVCAKENDAKELLEEDVKGNE